MVIVDDDAALRDTLRLLAEDADAEVVAEADNGHDAIRQAELHRPELLLLDVSMPGLGGFQAARALREKMPGLSIILISQYRQKAYADEALRLGVKGYVLKSAAARELRTAMAVVMGNGTFVSPEITK